MPRVAAKPSPGREPGSPLAPTLDRERALWDAGLVWVVGVDEVGVGPVCGPLVAAAVLLPPYCRIIPEVRDSKLLTAAQRRSLDPQVREQAVAIGVGAASVAEIERRNVLNAAHLAMRRALARIGRYDHALIDGRPIRDPDVGPHTAVIDGDATSYAIACASIVAKVIRDHLMEKLARRHPGYGWEHNAGYGSSEHLAALRQLGVTPYHRKTYEPVRVALGLPTEKPKRRRERSAA
ncbi:MAG TPA: ribonuclease HII [Chloroflexota bacterium]|nr:ribonuclease HII [Chloroflexota bacterium]